MSEEVISVYDGKYTLIYNSENSEFKCLRYGKEWRNLVGDGMILSLFFEIQRLKEKCGEE